MDVKTLFFSGVNSHQCVLHSLTDAHFLGYNCVLVEDCCGTTSPDFCREVRLWNVKLCSVSSLIPNKMAKGLAA